MADKSISQLNPASTITATDLFVLQQNNEAKNLPGQVLLNWLTAAADGHGGIASITKTSTSGLVDTYTITLADTSTYTYTITNGEKGDKGDTGQAWYMHVRYSEHEPTQDSDMSTAANNWIGVYSGTSETAPTTYTSYTWFEIKGEKGDKGDTGTAIQSQVVTYLDSTSGTIPPSGSWQSSVPTVAQGSYLWTRTVTTFTDNMATVTAYSVARMGMDGAGSVSMVNSQSPDASGNVTVSGSDILVSDTNLGTVADALATSLHDALEVTLPNVSDSARTFTVNGITADHELVQNGYAYLSNPAAAGSDLTLTTYADAITVGGTLTGTTNIVATFCLKDVKVTGTT